MIRAHIVEPHRDGPGKGPERHMGWCYFAQAPVDPLQPFAMSQGDQQQASPIFLRIKNDAYFILGWRWDAALADTPDALDMIQNQAELYLIVQKVEASPGGIVKAPGGTLELLKDRMPPPGGGKNDVTVKAR